MLKQYELDFLKAKLLDTYKIDIKEIKLFDNGEGSNNQLKVRFAFEKDSSKQDREIIVYYGESIESNITTLSNAIKEECNKYFLLDDVEIIA